MNLRGRLSETAGDAGSYAGHSSGYARRVLFGRAGGSVHQEAVIAELEPGGSVDRHLHAFEEAFYVIDGSLVLEVAGAVERLGADDYVFVDRGVAHALRNDSDAAVRWFEVAAPQPGATLEDTVFVTDHALPEGLERPYWRDHFDPAELPRAEQRHPRRLRRCERGRRRAEDPRRPRDRREPAQPDGRPVRARRLHHDARPRVRGGVLLPRGRDRGGARRGDAHAARRATTAGAASATRTRCINRSDRIVRWLETQVPQPPPRYQARFTAEWERFLAKP